jgi:hypothetical protein
MEGGPSHIDLFDPKPDAEYGWRGSGFRTVIKPVVTAMGEFHSVRCWGASRTWKQHGQSGTWVSDWLPHTAHDAWMTWR